MALKRAGIGSVNPGNADLLMLLTAGATEAEFVGAWFEARPISIRLMTPVRPPNRSISITSRVMAE